MTISQIRVEQISAQQTIPLRMELLRPGRAREESVFAGDDDPETVHVGAWLGEQLVGIASMYHESLGALPPGGGAPLRADHREGTAWRLRGMATSETVRRAGVGRRTLSLCLEHARARGGTLAWCNARMNAIAFYQAQGWQIISAPFDIPDVGIHVVMERGI